MKYLKLFFLALAFTAALVGVSAADSPRIIYDGAAIDHAGKALGVGLHKIEFRVYETPSGGKPVWREIIPAVQVDRGRFRAEIAREMPLDWTKDYYISLSFGNGPEGARRQKIYRSTDPRKAEALGGDLAYIVADAPPDVVEQSGCDMSIHPGGNWGAQIGIWRGVIANSNGDDTGNWSSLEPYCQDGYRYQCVEYPRKFYRIYMGMDTSQWFANGNQFYPYGPSWGLNRYANNGTSLPQQDDILCMDGSTYGHVAVVKGVSPTTVDVIQQNCSTTTAYRTLSVTNGIVQAWGSLYVQGWLRKPGYAPTPMPPILVSPTNEGFAPQGNTATVSAQKSSEGPVPDSYYFRLFDTNGSQIATSGWVSGTTSASYAFSVQPATRYQWTAKVRVGTTESAEATRNAFYVNIAPNPTTLISPAPGEWSTSSNVTFSWNPVTDPYPGPGTVAYRLSVTRIATGFTNTYYPVTGTSRLVSISVSGAYTWKVESSDTLDFSAPTQTRRAVVDTSIPSVESLGDLKAHGDGPTSVACGPVVVTAGLDKFGDTFYIGATDTSSGLEMSYDANGGPPVVAGDRLNLMKGTLGTSGGERVLQNALVSGITHGADVPGPVFTISRALGGGDFSPATPGVFGGTGLYNLGMLMTVCGSVTYKDPSGAFFYVDDGASLDDGSGHKGVRVSCTGLVVGNTINPPAQGTFAIVTGISSTASVSGHYVRCLRPRSQSDIAPR